MSSQLTSLFRSNAFAVLVGVDDYRSLDTSLGNPVGSSDLNGAVNDVRAWWRAEVAVCMTGHDGP